MRLSICLGFWSDLVCIMILLSEVTAGYRDQNPPTGEKVDTHSLTYIRK